MREKGQVKGEGEREGGRPRGRRWRERHAERKRWKKSGSRSNRGDGDEVLRRAIRLETYSLAWLLQGRKEGGPSLSS